MEQPEIIALGDRTNFLGSFTINSAFKFDRGKYIEWRCETDDGLYVVITYRLGLIAFRMGETEYECDYSNKEYLIGRVGGGIDMLSDRAIVVNNIELPRLSLVNILDFMKWDYRIGYV
jgi:hypothetical protein